MDEKKKKRKSTKEKIENITMPFMLIVPAVVFCVIMFATDLGFLVALLLAFVGLGFVAIISNALTQPFEKKLPNDYSEYTEETRSTVELLRRKLDKNETEQTLTQGFMDKNRILMVFGGEGRTTQKARYFYIINDAKFGCCMLDSLDGTLYFKVSPLQLQKHVEVHFQYNDPRLVYGLGTGEFRVEGGDYSSNVLETNKYFHCIEGEETVLIDKLYCNSTIWAEAKTSGAVAPFIGKEPYIHLEHAMTDKERLDMRMAKETGDPAAIMRSSAFAQTAARLTQEECQLVTDWVYQTLDEYSVAIETSLFHGE